MSPLLEVRDLSVGFAGPRVVSGISFEMEPGECLAIVGESGSGKSVTARSLLGLAGEGARVEASALRFDGTDLLHASPRRLRSLRGRDIGFVSQGALVALDPLRPVGREIADPLRLHGTLSVAERRRRVVELLTEVGVPEPELRASQRPGELSGGLRQRAVIASAIAMRPRLLVADEPTTALDTTVQAGILDLLERLRADGAAILLISHDLAVVSRLASRLLVMERGRVVESGSTATVLRSPEHPYTRRLVAAVPTGHPRWSRLTDAPVEPLVPARRESVLTASGLVRRFGSRVAVDDVSFRLERGRTLGIVGESGSGKTTVARLALALDRPDAGEVTLLGLPWSSTGEGERRARRPRIGAIYQDALGSLDPRWTVGQILADALSRGRSRRAGPDAVALLAQVGLGPELLRRRPRLLSGGQQQRVAIARAIAPRPDVIICDEPVSSLDVSVQAQVLDLLDDLQRSHGLSYLFISHDLGVVRHMSDDMIVMRAGRVVESGGAETIFSAPRHEYTRALIASAPRIGREPRARPGDPS
ncbi:MAG TPA: ABC transporter ATP-binding protein [Lacisediminihabitans sp.]|uniref:ABC transporter ATP-binding protein n=1 Tax=Lacisediminihabitans sp. TaxID=2787631 RepID=UPI002EDA3A06